uniref:TIR domain-containing protein n=1 Tax=Biomphalaria glabrata TaxID=6526 RepID=A0A2C9LZH5_BIOGL
MQDGNANSMWYSGDSPKQDTPSTSTSTSTTSVAPTDSTSTAPTDSTTTAPTDSTSTAPRETTSAAANATAASTMTTEAAVKPRTLEDRQCLPNIICQFGYCYRGDGNMFCLCDPGFGGMLCGETCPVDCGRYGSCAMAGGKPFCRCLKGYSGVPCKPSLSGTGKSPDSSVISKPSVQQKPIKNFNLSEIFDPWKEIPEYGPLQSLALRACTAGFICQYGNCSTNAEVLECECQESFTGVFCDTPCLLDCRPHGKCEINKETREEECFCFDVGYTGHNCSEIRPEEQEAAFPWAGVAVALSLLFLTVLVLMLLPYYLWKKRNITMMSFVHWLQPFEEDDGRQYDAFVSYASADLDRQFVIQTLVPRLEGRMCFTLCIHQRNFVPGLYITDNITESVKKSRRTLLIISPAYISSGWCKFEYQMALQEMLTEKHRILLIILGDVSHLADETDETLSAILKSVTWLEYPGKDASEQETERFWKRLELSLPKKRPGQSEPLSSQTCLVAPSISSKADLVEPEEKKAPLVLRSFKHQSLPGLPFQQIVRVPANDLESTSSMSETLCIRLGKLLSTSREDDLESQDVTSSQLALDPYYVSPSKMEPPLPDYDSDLKMPLTNNNHVGDGLLLEKSPAGMDIYSAPPSAAIKEFESKDMSALDNYLGDQTLVRQLAV